MYDQEHIDLALYRMDKAEEALTDAQDALRQGKCANAANRSYYAFFHAVRALFALEAKDFRKHSGVIANFQKDYVKTGVFRNICKARSTSGRRAITVTFTCCLKRKSPRRSPTRKRSLQR